MIKIRKATKEDAYDYAIILNQSWKDTYGEYINYRHIDDEFNVERLTKEFPEYIKNTDYELYMIEYNDEIAGILELGIPDEMYKENMKDFGECRTLHIRKQFQCKGIGTYAMKFLFERLKKLGYKQVCLWVKKQNKKAIKFYQNHGFIETKYTCENPTDGAPSFIMESDL